MSSITYRQFRDASRDKSISIYRDFFKYMYSRQSSIHQPIGVLMYCTQEDDNRFIMGPVPRSIKELSKLRDAIFTIHKHHRIKFINFTTMSVIDHDDPQPSLVSLVCDREIWDVSHVPLDIDFSQHRDSDDGQDHLFGIMDSNALEFSVESDWEPLGSTGDSHSEIAELFMQKMR